METRVGPVAPPRHSTIVEVAGLVSRIECRHLKPIVWACEMHPAVLSRKPPEVDLSIVYDDGYWGRRLPWIGPNSVPDVPEVSRTDHSLSVVTAYYRAELDQRTGRIDVRMASGFRVDGLVRTLYALLLPARGVSLLRAARVARNGGCILLVGLTDPPGAGLSAVAGDGAIFDGFVAVAETEGRYVACTTPFHDGDPRDERPSRLPLDALYFLERGAGARARIGPAEAARRLLPHVCVVEKTFASFERILDLSTRLVQALPCHRTSHVSCLESDTHAAQRA